MLRVAVEAASAMPWPTLITPRLCLALACALVGIGGGAEPAAVIEAPFAAVWSSTAASGMRILRSVGSRPLLVAVLVCVLLLTFDATLGFPGEGPTGALPYHPSTNALSSSCKVKVCFHVPPSHPLPHAHTHSLPLH